MAKKKVTIKEPRTSWEIKPYFTRYKFHSIYFLPTIVYTHKHDEDFYNECNYDIWRVSLRFLSYGVGVRVCKDKYWG